MDRSGQWQDAAGGDRALERHKLGTKLGKLDLKARLDQVQFMAHLRFSDRIAACVRSSMSDTLVVRAIPHDAPEG